MYLWSLLLGMLTQCMNTRYEVPSIWGYISFQISYQKEECHWCYSDHWCSRETRVLYSNSSLTISWDSVFDSSQSAKPLQLLALLSCSTAHAQQTLLYPAAQADLSEHHCKTRLATEIIWISMKFWISMRSKEKSGFNSSSKSQLDILMHFSSFVISSKWSIV